MHEDKLPCSGWTTSTLYSHFSALLAAQEKSVNSVQTAADRASDKADAAMEQRLIGLNELRKIVTDQQQSLLPRSEAEIRFKAEEVRLVIVEKLLSENTGRDRGLSVGWSILLAVAGLAGMLFGLLKK